MHTAVLCKLNQHPDVKVYVMTTGVKYVNPTIMDYYYTYYYVLLYFKLMEDLCPSLQTNLINL